MVIVVSSIVDSCDTYSQGEALRKAIVNQINAAGTASVSFAGVSYATSSFVNGAFAGLLKEFDLDQIKEALSIVNSHRQINDLVRRSMAAGQASVSRH